MKVVLLISVMCTLALLRGCQGALRIMNSSFVPLQHNHRPCQLNPGSNLYDMFVRQHIVRSIPQNEAEWEEYLTDHNLCNRKVCVQSFMEDEESVKQICNGSGKRLGDTNLCMSMSPMVVYDVTVDQSCKVERVRRTTKPVIVACDKLDNGCLPVHFQKYRNQQPKRNAKRCKP